MLKITKPSANRVDLDLSGELDAAEMQTGLDRLIAEAEGVENGVMLYTITSFAIPTMGALGIEFTRLPSLFALLGKFDKCAVVTDIEWIKTAAEIEGAIIPGLDIKAFSFSEQDQAEAWLTA